MYQGTYIPKKYFRQSVEEVRATPANLGKSLKTQKVKKS
jgi:hypothetical protein